MPFAYVFKQNVNLNKIILEFVIYIVLDAQLIK